MSQFVYIILMTLTILGGDCWAEGACFHSVSEAAAQSGQRDDTGFRAIEFRRDVFSQLMWAKVASCARPERPPVVVPAALSGSTVMEHSLASKRSAAIPIVVAGARVSIMRVEEHLRIVMIGTALSNGCVGERIRVKLEPVLDGAAEKFVVGVVRPDGALEMGL